MMPNNPLVSIITPTLNQADFIEHTILSVLGQSYPNIEYIVIDGGSTDGTLDILRRYEDRLRWISEPDQGQASAINKGFRLATGDILGWLNSDDVYLDGAIDVVARHFMTHPDHAFVYGDALALNREGNSFGVRSHVRQTDLNMLLNESDYIVQPASFWRRSLWETVGELDEALFFTLDYEYWMRVAKRYALHYIPVPLAAERMYGDAKTFKGSIKRLVEIEQVAVRHGGMGMPRRFQPEAKATYLAEGISLWLRGKFSEGRPFIAQSQRYGGNMGLWVGYTGTILLLGFNRLSMMRLYGNRLRQLKRWVAGKLKPNHVPS